jgi:hypothetical protein
MSETGEKAPRKKRGKATLPVEKPPPPRNDWRSQRYEVVPIDSVRPREDNPNEGDSPAIAESIDANGFFGAILVGGDGRILVGAHRWAELKASGETECPVIRLSVEDERGIAIMIAENATRDHAKTNENKLADLLARLPAHRGLGIKPPDVTALLERARPTLPYLSLMRQNGAEPEPEPAESDEPEDEEDSDDEHDRTDVVDDYDGGPREDEEPEADAAPARQEVARVPLAIVLTNSEARKWAEYKKSIGARRDVEAFRVLLAAVTRTDDGEA